MPQGDLNNVFEDLGRSFSTGLTILRNFSKCICGVPVLTAQSLNLSDNVSSSSLGSYSSLKTLSSSIKPKDEW